MFEVPSKIKICYVEHCYLDFAIPFVYELKKTGVLEILYTMFGGHYLQL